MVFVRRRGRGRGRGRGSKMRHFSSSLKELRWAVEVKGTKPLGGVDCFYVYMRRRLERQIAWTVDSGQWTVLFYCFFVQ